MCIYLRNNISFKTCLKSSNSVCDLLIVSLQTPSLIIILVYHPPSCPIKDFEEISLKMHTYVMSLPSPLPNIIFLGDFNLSEINWSSLNPNCHSDSVFRRTLLGYYAEGMHANFKENLI